MSRVKIRVFPAVILLSCSAVFSQPPEPARKYPLEVTITLPSGWKIKADAARTETERQRGLMYRKSLPENKGMLFVFDKEELRRFWMKNTYLDLDIIYIGEDRRIKKIFHRVPRAAGENSGDVAAVNGSGMYVLEMAAGFAREHRLWPGQKLSFDCAWDDGGKEIKNKAVGGSNAKSNSKR